MIPRAPLQPDQLLKDILSLEKRFRRELGDSQRLDRVRGFGGPDSPYDDFAPCVGRLFKQTRQAFEKGRTQLARDAYSALFALLSIKDDYGFGMPRPESLQIVDEQARYLRAVAQTASPGDRSNSLIQTKRKLAKTLWEGCDVKIHSVLEIAPLADSERGEWLDELINRLSLDRKVDADRWLREAVKLRWGGDGLRDLARRDSPWRPRAWLDWLDVLAEQESPRQMLDAAQEALAHIPEALELRVNAADHLARAATSLGDRKHLMIARWEAFRVEPYPARLLDLRMAAADVKEQRDWMRRLAITACDPKGGLIQGPLVDGWQPTHEVLFKEDRDYFTSGPTNVTLACAWLLAGDWRKALKMACDDTFGDWDNNGSVQMLVVPVISAWLTRWPEKALPFNLAELLDIALRLLDDPNNIHLGLGQRIKVALSESVAGWKPPLASVSESTVARCLRLVRGGIASTLNRNASDRAGRAALLAAAAAELIHERCSATAESRFWDGLTRTHRKDREFLEALALRRRSREGAIMADAKRGAEIAK